MRRKRSISLAVVFALGALASVIVPSTAAAVIPATFPASAVDVPDQVLVWNQHAYDELIVGQGPFSLQHMAMVHGAIYDAVNAIDGGHQPYLVAPPAAPTYSKDAAAATAAHDVLLFLLPGRQAVLDGFYDASLAVIPDGPDEQGGIDVGGLPLRR